MDNRYDKVVYKDENGKVFELIKPKNREFIIFDGDEKGELIVRAIVDDYSQNYTNPPIPEGYRHVLGEWDTGFVIERCSDKSQFTWVHVGYLDSDGTLDGTNYNEKFGRRAFLEENLYLEYDEDLLNESFAMQLESVRVYGGFYISSFAISMGEDNEEPHSVKNEEPWTWIDFDSAYDTAKNFEKENGISSHLPYGSEYDSILSWFHKSKDVSIEDINVDSSDCGNFANFKVALTGSSEQWCNKNIYDFFGNVEEWTQEIYFNNCDYSTYNVARGGSTFSDYLVATRIAFDDLAESEDVGFRIALCISPNAKVTYTNKTE